ncbi:MAG: hypothetical protein J0M10_11180 [Chitinophagales bacterium]|nr:hypothetical protein [Chitinophagales bacterium]
MKVIKFVAFLFYRYYSTGGTRRIPYFSTLCALAMMLYIHLFQILILINRVDDIIPGGGNETRPVKYLKMGLFFIPIFLLLANVIRKKELEQMSYDKVVVRKGYLSLVGYLILSFAVLILLILYKKGKL